MKFKNSTALLLSIVTIAIAWIVLSAFQKKKHITERTIISSEFLLGAGDYRIDTIKANYHHIVTNFPATTYDVRIENEVIIEGYENAWPHVSAKVSNDTLYLAHKILGRHYIASRQVNGEYTMLVTLGVKNVQSIHLYDEARLFVNANPFGQNADGKTVYKPIDEAQYRWKTDQLHISDKSQKTLQILVDIGTLRLDTEKGNAGMNVYGPIRHLIMHNPKGRQYNSEALKVDTATIISEKGIVNSGTISLDVTDYLHAELHSNLDITYKGSPEINKIETSYGRVVDNNLYKRVPDRGIRIKTDTMESDSVIKMTEKIMRDQDPAELIKL